MSSIYLQRVASRTFDEYLEEEDSEPHSAISIDRRISQMRKQKLAITTQEAVAPMIRERAAKIAKKKLMLSMKSLFVSMEDSKDVSQKPAFILADEYIDEINSKLAVRLEKRSPTHILLKIEKEVPEGQNLEPFLETMCYACRCATFITLSVTIEALQSLPEKYLQKLALCIKGIDCKVPFPLPDAAGARLLSFLEKATLLKEVNFSGCKSLTTDWVKELLHRCPELKTLDISDTGVTNSLFFSNDKILSHQRLSALNMRNLPLDDPALELVARSSSFPKLRRLDLSGTKLQGTAIPKLLSSHAIRLLNVKNCPRVTKELIKAALFVDPQCQILHDFESISIPFSNEELLLSNLLNYLRSLFTAVNLEKKTHSLYLQVTPEALDINENVQIETLLPLQVMQFLEKYKISLVLHYSALFSRPTSLFTRFLDEIAPLIDELIFLPPKALSPTRSQSVRKWHFPNARYVVLRNCPIANGDFHTLSCPQLSGLDLGSCSNLTRALLPDLLKRYPQLSELHFQGTQAIGPELIFETLEKNPKLQNFFYSLHPAPFDFANFSPSRQVMLLQSLQSQGIQAVDELSQKIRLNEKVVGQLLQFALRHKLQNIEKRCMGWLKANYGDFMQAVYEKSRLVITFQEIKNFTHGPKAPLEHFKELLRQLAKDMTVQVVLTGQATGKELIVRATLEMLLDTIQDRVQAVLFSPTGTKNQIASLETVVNHCPHVSELVFINCALAKGALRHIVQWQKTLSILHFEGCTGVKGKEFAQFSATMPLVQQLHIVKNTEIRDDDIEVLAKTFPHLTTLEFNFCPELTRNAILPLADLMAKLETLAVVACPKLATDGLEAICKQRMPKLKNLALSYSKVQNKQLQLLEAPLERLCIKDCTEIDDSVVALIAERFPQIKFLDVGRCPRITMLSLPNLLQRCEQLEELSLNSCQQIPHQVQRLFASKVKWHDTLEIDGSLQIPADVLELMTLCYRSASRLIFRKMHETNYSAFAYLCSKARQNDGRLSKRGQLITSLIYEGHLDGENTLRMIGHSFRALTELSIAGLPQFTDEEIEKLTQQFSTLL